MSTSFEVSVEQREEEVASAILDFPDLCGWFVIGDCWGWATFGRACERTMGTLLRNIAVAGALQIAFEAGAQYEVQIQCREVPEWHPDDRRPCPWVAP